MLSQMRTQVHKLAELADLQKIPHLDLVHSLHTTLVHFENGEKCDGF